MTWITIGLVALAVTAFALWWFRVRPHRTSAAQEALERAEAQRPEVERLVHDLRARRAKNNFAPLIDKALRGGS